MIRLFLDGLDQQSLLQDGPVWLDAGDGRVLRVDVFGLRVRHLGLVDHQPDRGGARTRHGGGSYADYVPFGPSDGERRSSAVTNDPPALHLVCVNNHESADPN